MSLLKSVVKKDKTRRPADTRGPQPSYFPQVIQKLRDIPEHNQLNNTQLHELVNRITKAEDLISYFDLSQEQEGANAEVDTLPVQLVLKYLQAKPHGIEATLLEEYGPIHTCVVIGDQILEWNWKSVVIPHGKPMKDGAALLPAGQKDEAFGVREAELPCVETQLLKDKVLAGVANYNKQFYFDPIKRNSQDFVWSVLHSMNLEKPTQLKSKLKDYYSALEEKKRDFIPTEFSSHEELDTFVEQNITKLNNIEIEYLLAQYFIFHLGATMRKENPVKWECCKPDCKTVFLEALFAEIKFPPEKLLLHKYKSVKYNFQQSTLL